MFTPSVILVDLHNLQEEVFSTILLFVLSISLFILNDSKGISTWDLL